MRNMYFIKILFHAQWNLNNIVKVMTINTYQTYKVYAIHTLCKIVFMNKLTKNLLDSNSSKNRRTK